MQRKKKVLLLGGSRYLLPVIETAHELGYYVITCDYLPNNIAHRYSDEYHNVSIVEKEKVLELAKELQIDGILSFACDPGVVTAAYVAEELGLPFAGSYEAVSLLQNKARFRQFLADNHFPVPRAGGYTSCEEALRDAELFRWPVIVKPVDSAGSKGVTRVNTPQELEASVAYALSYSHSGKFIMEEFVEKVGDSSDSDCFSVDGKLVFASFSNQKFDAAAQNPYTPSAYTWPSAMPEAAQRDLCEQLERLFDLLQLRSSIYNVETRLGTDGKAYIMEVSPRGGGNRLSEMLKYATGTDLIKNTLLAAVGEPCDELEFPTYHGCLAECILHSAQEGTFKELKVHPDLHVVERDMWVAVGDKVNPFTGANEAIGTLVLQFDSQETMEATVNAIDTYVEIIVE